MLFFADMIDVSNEDSIRAFVEIMKRQHNVQQGGEKQP